MTRPLLGPGQTVACTAIGTPEGKQLITHVFALGNCLGDALTRFGDALLDHGVHENIVEQPIGGEQEVAHIGTDARETLDIAQLVRQAGKRALRRIEVLLRGLHPALFERGDQKPTAEHVEKTPVPRALEISRGSVETIQCILNRRKGLVDLDLPLSHVGPPVHFRLLPRDSTVKSAPRPPRNRSGRSPIIRWTNRTTTGRRAMCDQDELQDQTVSVTAAEPLAEPSCDVEGAEDEPSGQIPAFLAQNPMAATHAAETPDESAGENKPAGENVRDTADADGGEPEAAEPEGTEAVETSGPSGLFSEGVASIKAMSSARRAHAEARDELERLQNTIAAREAELEHRRSIEANYDEIIERERTRKSDAEQAAEDLKAQRDATAERVSQLKRKLEQMREEDTTTEKRLKVTLDAATDKEQSARESGRRLQNRLDDAKSDLERLNEERRASLIASEQAIASAEKRLATLNAEYAELQRNPSANSAEYSVRTRELEFEISDAAAALRSAREDLPQTDRETQRAIDEAIAAVAAAEKPIAAAKTAFDEAAAASDKARDAYSEAKEAAEARQKELRKRIGDEEKSLKSQDRSITDKLDEASAAQAVIDEAEDVIAHPEVTEAIAHALEADRAEHGDRVAEVEELANTERDVREQTRASRIRFIAAITGIALLAILAIWMLL